jgi:hypothetical protein
MNFKTIHPYKSIALAVKSILIFEETDLHQKTILPFFADGYPGLIFQDGSVLYRASVSVLTINNALPAQSPGG